MSTSSAPGDGGRIATFGHILTLEDVTSKWKNQRAKPIAGGRLTRPLGLITIPLDRKVQFVAQVGNLRIGLARVSNRGYELMMEQKTKLTIYSDYV
jgi:hypothetical protein